jgi:hypothetical protein
LSKVVRIDADITTRQAEKPKSMEEILTRVEAETGKAGRVAFERFLKATERSDAQGEASSTTATANAARGAARSPLAHTTVMPRTAAASIAPPVEPVVVRTGKLDGKTRKARRRQGQKAA